MASGHVMTSLDLARVPVAGAYSEWWSQSVITPAKHSRTEALPSGGAAVGVLSVIFVGVPAALGPVPVSVLELAVRDRL